MNDFVPDQNRHRAMAGTAIAAAGLTLHRKKNLGGKLGRLDLIRNYLDQPALEG